MGLVIWVLRRNRLLRHIGACSCQGLRDLVYNSVWIVGGDLVGKSILVKELILVSIQAIVAAPVFFWRLQKLRIRCLHIDSARLENFLKINNKKIQIKKKSNRKIFNFSIFQTTAKKQTK